MSVTDNTSTSRSFAESRQAERIGDGGEGIVLEWAFTDAEMDKFLIAPKGGTKTGEAIIPFDVWPQLLKPKRAN